MVLFRGVFRYVCAYKYFFYCNENREEKEAVTGNEVFVINPSGQETLTAKYRR